MQKDSVAISARRGPATGCGGIGSTPCLTQARESLFGDNKNASVDVLPSSGNMRAFGCVRPHAHAQEIKTVFVIAMENHNWTQPAANRRSIQQIYNNPNAPFINSLVNGNRGRLAVYGKASTSASKSRTRTPITTCLRAPPLHIHPSEPNYIWSEAGTNFGILNDNTPYPSPAPIKTSTTTPLTSTSQRRIDLEVLPGRHRLPEAAAATLLPQTNGFHRSRTSGTLHQAQPTTAPNSTTTR